MYSYLNLFLDVHGRPGNPRPSASKAKTYTTEVWNVLYERQKSFCFLAGKEITEDAFKKNKAVKHEVNNFCSYVIKHWSKDNYDKDTIIRRHLKFFNNLIDFSNEDFAKPIEALDKSDEPQPKVPKVFDNGHMDHEAIQAIYTAAEQALRIDHGSNAAADVLSAIKGDKELAKKLKDYINMNI